MYIDEKTHYKQSGHSFLGGKSNSDNIHHIPAHKPSPPSQCLYIP